MPLVVFTGRATDDPSGAASIKCDSKRCRCQQTDLRAPLPGQAARRGTKTNG